MRYLFVGIVKSEEFNLLYLKDPKKTAMHTHPHSTSEGALDLLLTLSTSQWMQRFARQSSLRDAGQTSWWGQTWRGPSGWPPKTMDALRCWPGSTQHQRTRFLIAQEPYHSQCRPSVWPYILSLSLSSSFFYSCFLRLSSLSQTVAKFVRIRVTDWKCQYFQILGFNIYYACFFCCCCIEPWPKNNFQNFTGI